MISSIRVQNFRIFKDRKFDFDEQVNIIVGQNAKGKTSLLEAILVNLNGSSYRAKDKDLIIKGSDWLRIESVYDGLDRIVKFTLNNDKIFEIANDKFKRLPASAKEPIVLFEPNNLIMLTSSPDSRRSYLDNLLKQIDPLYKKNLNHYSRALIQRNTLLKNMSIKNKDQLFPWNIRITQLAEEIVKRRIELINEINPVLISNYKEISQSDLNVQIRYQSSIDIYNYSSKMLSELENNFIQEINQGFTSVGPHRDDFTVYFDDNLASLFASRGELRSAMLSLKVTEVNLLEKYLFKKPILLLDDVFSELDSSRRHALTNLIKQHQSFITTTDADIASKEFRGHCKVIKL
jgi:DNA replication and repair protein RecF